MTGAERYLDLLKKVLTNTLVAAEPDASAGDATFVMNFLEHYVRGPAVTMLPRVRLDNIQACIEDALAHDVPGDVIETGVWRGGATIFMRAVLAAHGVYDRTVWVADSFAGLPEPDPARFPLEAKAHHGPVMQQGYQRFAAGLEEVRANFARFGLLDERVHFLPGWFKDTLPQAPIERIAVMRLDGDYYASTMDALTNLYDKLATGGYAIVDDYGEESWTYCRRAVDEFRAARGIDDRMIQVDRQCFYWQRGS
jgi:hypothetical protein